MKYKRVEVFTLSRLLMQIVDYIKEFKKLPRVIFLPPEEYIYINYLLDNLHNQVDSFLNIPLKINYDEQEKSFQY